MFTVETLKTLTPEERKRVIAYLEALIESQTQACDSPDSVSLTDE